MESEPCPVDVPNDEKPSAEPPLSLEKELFKSLNELVQLLGMQLQIESRRNDLLTELLAHNQLIIDRVLESEPIEVSPDNDPDNEEDEPMMGLDGKPITVG